MYAITYDISPILHYFCSLAGISLILTIILGLWFYHRSKTLRDLRKAEANGEIDYLDELPGVTVVVYAKNDADYLERFLPSVLEQDYPAFQVIVVNDGSTDATKDLLSDMEVKYKNLYQTFAPEDTRNLSKKKLSLMLGIKAAKYDIILTTNANCQPVSRRWLALMMRNFVPGTDVVIGCSHYSFAHDRNLLRWYRAFHFMRNAVQYLVFALRGKPYRGTSDNLAYRRQTFFDNKGFSRTMNMHFGDDDLFLSEIANGANTRVELSPESFMVSHFDKISQAFSALKLRYDFTSSYLHTTAFAESSFMSAAYYVDVLAIAALVALDYENVTVIASALALLLMLTIPQIIFYRREAALLKMPRLFFSVPLFSLFQPIVNCWYKIRGRRKRTMNFTWRRS